MSPNIAQSIVRLLRDEEATTAVEYAVLLAMIVMAAITAIGSLGSASSGVWGSVASTLSGIGFGGS